MSPETRWGERASAFAELRTDVAALYGAEGGAKIVQQLGRWHSDVSHIYSRAQAQPLLDATATMANAEGGALEALVPGWTQPAWR